MYSRIFHELTLHTSQFDNTEREALGGSKLWKLPVDDPPVVDNNSGDPVYTEQVTGLGIQGSRGLRLPMRVINPFQRQLAWVSFISTSGTACRDVICRKVSEETISTGYWNLASCTLH